MKSTRKAEIAVLILMAFLTVRPRGTAAQRANSQTADSVQPKVTGLEGNLEADDIIRVDVEHFAEWAAAKNPTKLVPYLNGIAIRGR